jgi:hypothetical protein
MKQRATRSISEIKAEFFEIEKNGSLPLRFD